MLYVAYVPDFVGFLSRIMRHVIDTLFLSKLGYIIYVVNSLVSKGMEAVVVTSQTSEEVVLT
jgi:hypothetical protein